MRSHATYIFEALSLVEREEWVRALTLCITGGDELDLRRRSLQTATLAPIFMFDKVSNVCTICSHSFAVYRPRHHCRYEHTLHPKFSRIFSVVASPSLTRQWWCVGTGFAALLSAAIAQGGDGRFHTARVRKRRVFVTVAHCQP